MSSSRSQQNTHGREHGRSPSSRSRRSGSSNGIAAPSQVLSDLRVSRSHGQGSTWSAFSPVASGSMSDTHRSGNRDGNLPGDIVTDTFADTAVSGQSGSASGGQPGRASGDQAGTPSSSARIKCLKCEIPTFRANRALYLEHMKNEHGYKHLCQHDECLQVFYRPSSRKKHESNVHNEPTRRFTCQVCGGGLPDRRTFTQHMRRAHPDVST